MEHNYHRKTIVNLMDTQENQDTFWKIGIEYNCNIFINKDLYQTYSISPYEVENFALGYCLTSGKLSNKDDILNVSHEIDHENEIVNVHIQLKNHVYDNFKNNSKPQEFFSPFADNTKISHANFHKGALKFMEISQQEKEDNYSLHMGCWFNSQGELQSMCYDLSRHVALDKTLGKAFNKNILNDDDNNNINGFLVMSSRAAYELLNKAINAGVKNIIFMSAPTTWAIKVSTQHNINLMVFFKNKLHKFTP